MQRALRGLCIVALSLLALSDMPSIAAAQNCGPNTVVPPQSYTVGFVQGFRHYTVQLTLRLGSLTDAANSMDTYLNGGSYRLSRDGNPVASGSLVGFGDADCSGARPLYAFVEFVTNSAETTDIPLDREGHTPDWLGGVPEGGVGWLVALRPDAGKSGVQRRTPGTQPGGAQTDDLWPASQVIQVNSFVTAAAMNAQLNAKFPQSVPPAAVAQSHIAHSTDDGSTDIGAREDAASQASQDSGNSIAIQPVYQENSEWCWAAVGQMVFQHFHVPGLQRDYQCGIVSLIKGGFVAVPGGRQWVGPCFPGCELCNIPAGQFQNLRAVLTQYPTVARVITRRPSSSLATTFSSSALSKATIMKEIDADRPIIAGVSPDAPMPGGEAEHVVLLVGYALESGRFYLLVNDPWPYDSFPGIPNPYLTAGGQSTVTGQYKIEISRFTTKLRWTRALWNIHPSGL